MSTNVHADTFVPSPMANLTTTSLSAARTLVGSALKDAAARVQAESNQAAARAIAGYS